MIHICHKSYKTHIYNNNIFSTVFRENQVASFLDIRNTLFMWGKIWSSTEFKWSEWVCFEDWSNCNTGNQWPKGVCLCPHIRNFSITEYGVFICVTSNVLYRYAIWDLGNNFDYSFDSTVNLRKWYYLLYVILLMKCCKSNFIYHRYGFNGALVSLWITCISKEHEYLQNFLYNGQMEAVNRCYLHSLSIEEAFLKTTGINGK